MKGSIGISTNVYGSIIPYSKRWQKSKNISKEAKQRLKWIDHYQLKSKNARLTCRHFGIPPSLFYKWYNRFKKLGLSGLEDQSKKPHTFRKSMVPVKNIDLIRKIRVKYPYFSKYKIAVILKRDFDIEMSESTIGRVIKKHNLFFKPRIKSKKERYKVARRRLPKEFKSLQPGDLIQGDTKHISFLGPKRYFYVITDCLTKIASVRVSASPSSQQSVEAVKRARKHFPYEFKRFQNDNGSENLKNLVVYLNENDIEQFFTRPRTPKDNAFVERLIGTLEREFIQQGNLSTDIEEQQELIDQWLEEYNKFRPHQSLNYLTPYEFYEKITK